MKLEPDEQGEVKVLGTEGLAKDHLKLEEFLRDNDNAAEIFKFFADKIVNCQ